MAAKKHKTKPPGRNIAEAERHSAPVKLRVHPLIATAIAERAAELGVDKSAYVTRLVVADVARAKGGDGSSPQSSEEQR